MTTTLSEIWAKLPKANKRAVIAGGFLATWGIVLIVSAATNIPCSELCKPHLPVPH
jgi:hypothetical protein